MNLTKLEELLGIYITMAHIWRGCSFECKIGGHPGK